jgi:predicted phage tail protein
METLEGFDEGSDNPEAVAAKHDVEQIQGTRESVSRFRQSSLQTPNVLSAIMAVENHAEAIQRLLEEGAKRWRVNNALRDLWYSERSLNEQVPGNYSEAIGNSITSSGDHIQINAPIGDKPGLGRTFSIARNNSATNSFQNNAPIYGPAEAFTSYRKRE